MLKKFLSALTAGLLLLSILPVSGFAVQRYEILQIGDEDAWVMELQEKLNELGYLKVPATGYYGTNTQNAVISYQRDHGLSADGKAGPITRQSILGDAYEPITGPRDDRNQSSIIVSPDSGENSVSGSLSGGEEQSAQGSKPSPEPTKAPQDTAPAPEPEASAAPSAKPSTPAEAPQPNPEGEGDDAADDSVADANALQLGDKGDAISALQEKLKELEYYDYDAITGYYGPVTEEAVKKFERTNGLEEDGIMSLEDLAILNSEHVEFYSMYPGDEGDDIRAMQERLIELGYLEPEATGYYGTATTLAVKTFQENNDIVADGTAGKETRALLFSDDAVPSDGTKEPDEDPDENDAEPTDPDTIPGTGVTKLINVAESQTGKRYSYGSSGPNAYDCSGLVYYALKGAGVSIGRMSSAGYASVSSWKTIKSMDDLKIGDLVFFRSDSSSSISHVGIYAGGGDFIHSAPSIGGVGLSDMSSGYYERNFVTAKRVF